MRRQVLIETLTADGITSLIRSYSSIKEVDEYGWKVIEAYGRTLIDRSELAKHILSPFVGAEITFADHIIYDENINPYYTIYLNGRPLRYRWCPEEIQDLMAIRQTAWVQNVVTEIVGWIELELEYDRNVLI